MAKVGIGGSWGCWRLLGGIRGVRVYGYQGCIEVASGLGA